MKYIEDLERIESSKKLQIDNEQTKADLAATLAINTMAENWEDITEDEVRTSHYLRTMLQEHCFTMADLGMVPSEKMMKLVRAIQNEDGTFIS